MPNLTYSQAVEKADALKSLGQSEVYLYKPTDAPWEYVTKVEAGGTHRMDMNTSVWFSADHPCGLSFRWGIDLEKREANGNGYYLMDVAGINDTMARLTGKSRKMFAKYLLMCAAKVQESAEKYALYVGSQFADAALLRVLADPKPKPAPAATE